MNLIDAIESFRHFGIRPVIQGGVHRLAKKSGWLKRRFSQQPWETYHLADFLADNVKAFALQQYLDSRPFLAIDEIVRHPELLAGITPTDDILSSAVNNIKQGIFTYYSHRDVKHDNPINWHLSPFTRQCWPQDTHWSVLPQFDSCLGDIKDVWELARFGWSYVLVRHFARTGDKECPEIFWRYVESWIDANEPNSGVHWLSGQECALRMMAWCFSLFAYRNLEGTTETRLHKLLLAIALQTERIEGFIAHAIRQKTNHALTEAAGLYTIGILFPFFQRAPYWHKLGKKILEQEALRQIYDDGGYVQQSMNYHRLMLQTYLWVFRLAELYGDAFSSAIRDRVAAATDFLYQMQDEPSGRVPNYGANDGALILPLNNCDYLDYRPVLQACRYLFHKDKLYKDGPWDEDMLWLFGPVALNASHTYQPKTSRRYDTSGYYTLRTDNAWAMIRCHTYKDRVGHVDPLHLDLWADGENLLCDCGSYRYYAPLESELEYYFKSIWAHNTLIINRKSPLRLASKFIWLPWPRAQVIKFDPQANSPVFTGRNFAYKHEKTKYEHQREVKANCQGTRWEITDIITGRQSGIFNLRWNVPVFAHLLEQCSTSADIELTHNWNLTLQYPTGNAKVRLLSSDPDGGWESLYYGEKQPIATVSLEFTAVPPLAIITILSKKIIKESDG